jgi:HEAT repeat protein
LPIINEFQQIDFESKEELARKLISELNKREPAKITSESAPLSVCKSKSTDFKSNMPSIPAYVESIKNNDFFRYITNPMVSRSIPLESLYVKLAISGTVHDPEHRLAVPDWAAGQEYRLFVERRYLEKVKEEMDPETAVEKWRRIVVLGDPGSGKTTLLKYLTLEAANGRLKGELVPFFISLGEYADPRNKATSLMMVRDLNEKRKTLFLLDGFDEIPHDLKQGVSGDIGRELNRYLLSSRQVGYTGGVLNDKMLEVVELSDPTIREFVQNWTCSQRMSDHEKSAERLIDHLRIPRLKMLARNPLLLSIQCFVYQSMVESGTGMEMPTRRVELYRESITGLLKTLERRGITSQDVDSLNRRINVDSVFGAIAFHYFEEVEKAPRHIFSREELNECLRRISGKLDDHYVDLLSDVVFRSEILHPLTMHEYHFLHLTFQEYYTAHHLAHQADGIQTIVERKRDRHWQEIIPLYAGMKSERFQELMDRIWGKGRGEDLFYNNLFLIGRCLVEVDLKKARIKSRDIEEIINQLLDLSLRGRFGMWSGGANEVLSHISHRFGDIEDKLIESLKDDDFDVRETAANALGRIGGERAIEHLIPLLNDDDSDVRETAANVLGGIGGERVIEYLIPLLNDDEYYVIWGAANALGRIGGERVIEYLIPLLKDNECEVRETAANALGRIGDEGAIEHLIPLLKDDNSGVKREVADAFGEIGGEKAIEYLVPLLNDDDSGVRETAANALGRIGGERVIEYLIPLLKDNECEVRETAANTLVRIGGERAIEYLIPLLKDDEYEVREAAARAFGGIGGESAIEHLIPLLKDDHPSVRLAAANALGRIGDEGAIEYLIPLLKDDEYEVREAAANALGRIGDEGAIEHLIPLLKDDEYDVREAAANALGRIGGEGAIEHLIQLLKYDDSGVMETAAEALKRISEKNDLYIPMSKYTDL